MELCSLLDADRDWTAGRACGSDDACGSADACGSDDARGSADARGSDETASFGLSVSRSEYKELINVSVNDVNWKIHTRCV